MINTKIWTDDYFAELSLKEKMIWIYLLTNRYTHICGIYQIPIRFIANETGIDKKEVDAAIEKLIKDNKIKYLNGYIALKNFIKNQNLTGQSIIDGVKIGLESSPPELALWVKDSMTEGSPPPPHPPPNPPPSP